jgi:hypothetical protein
MHNMAEGPKPSGRPTTKAEIDARNMPDAPTNHTNNGLDLLHGPRADIG